MEGLAKAVRQEKEIKSRQIEKKGSLFFFVDDTIIYVERIDHKIFLELITNYSMIVVR